MRSQKQNISGNVKAVHVIPISRGIGTERLTYFTAQDIQAGSIVTIPIRKRTVEAIVASVDTVASTKTTIKSSSFSIRKILAVKQKVFFLPEFVSAACEAADYFAGTTGSVLHSVIPRNIDEYVSTSSLYNKKRQQKQSGIKSDVCLIQSGDKERISAYKSIIREEFARKSSVFFCVPEINEISRIGETLEKGIEEYTYILHSGISKKELHKKWGKILQEKHPVLIVATGMFLSLPRTDIGTIILEKESSRSYKTKTRPFVDIRIFTELFARKAGIRLIMGDILLRPETLYKKDEGVYTEFSPLKFRSLSTAKQYIVDMKPKDDITVSAVKKFPIISDELRELIKNIKKESGSMFILSARRGLYPLTVCNDCGRTVMCPHCGNPSVLHKKDPVPPAKQKYIVSLCHKCGYEEKAQDRCPSCGGWKLTTLGIGTELVEKVIKEEFPGITIFRINKDSVKTHKKAVEIRDKFYASPGSILIGTEMAVPYIDKELDHIIVSSVDSLFTIPDFRISERVFGTLFRLRAYASKNFLIQTRDIDNRIFKYVAKGNLIDFYREEIEGRKILKYPPFSMLVKITRTGTREAVIKDMAYIKDEFKNYKPDFLPLFPEGGAQKTQKKYGINAIIKAPYHPWPNEKLLEKLRLLPPSFVITIDPESVL